MNQQRKSNKLELWLSQENLCPYLKDRFSRVVGISTHDTSDDIHSFLSCKHGFRRSRDVLYNNACIDCQQCISVRIDVDNFIYKKSWKRIINKNKNLYTRSIVTKATDEQFTLLQEYLQFRHNESDMLVMNFDEYQAMVENTGVSTCIFEYREFVNHNLAGVMIADTFDNGLSLVYSYYAEEKAKYNLGNYLILEMIAYARKQNIGYVYPGYYIEQSSNMKHKARYQPLQRLDKGQWKDFLPIHEKQDDMMFDEYDGKEYDNDVNYDSDIGYRGQCDYDEEM